jgi:hypothetical protein
MTKTRTYYIPLCSPIVVHETKRAVITVPAWRAFATCADCETPVRNEWAMLRRPIWERVWPGTALKSVHEQVPMQHFLCVGCIETRLGRRLNRSDFDMRRKCNYPTSTEKMSRRLQARIRKD